MCPQQQWERRAAAPSVPLNFSLLFLGKLRRGQPGQGNEGRGHGKLGPQRHLLLYRYKWNGKLFRIKVHCPLRNVLTEPPPRAPELHIPVQGCAGGAPAGRGVCGAHPALLELLQHVAAGSAEHRGRDVCSRSLSIPSSSLLGCAVLTAGSRGRAGLGCVAVALQAGTLPIARPGPVSPAASQHLLKPEGAFSPFPFRCRHPAALFSSHNHTPAQPCNCGLGCRM